MHHLWEIMDMNRTNAVLLSLVVSMLLGANVVAHEASPENLPGLPQSAASSESQVQPGIMSIPLLVTVGKMGQIRDVQHSQRLPSDVNRLLWRSIQGWVKSSAKVNGRRAAAQVFMTVTLHAEPRADGESNVYFTLASMGPVMRGR